MQVKYMESIRGLKCPYCGAGKKLSRPKVSIVVEADGRGYVVCLSCLNRMQTPSGLLGEALTQWMSKVGTENEIPIYDSLKKVMDKNNDLLLINSMIGFGDEYFRKYVECKKKYIER